MKKIVIIEDDLAISQMYRMKFESDAFMVNIASDGRAGIELIKTIQPDLIMLDLLMPTMTGQQVLTAIRTDQAIAHIPVVILTNTESEQIKLETEQLGVAAYIIKANETPSQVVAKIKQVLGI